MNNKHCEWCDHQFETKVSYQIYCSAECREAATKEKIAQNYMLKRIKNRIGKNRKCKSCGGNLSIYNEEQICAACTVNPSDVKDVLKDIKGLFKDETK